MGKLFFGRSLAVGKQPARRNRQRRRNTAFKRSCRYRGQSSWRRRPGGCTAPALPRSAATTISCSRTKLEKLANDSDGLLLTRFLELIFRGHDGPRCRGCEAGCRRVGVTLRLRNYFKNRPVVRASRLPAFEMVSDSPAAKVAPHVAGLLLRLPVAADLAIDLQL